MQNALFFYNTSIIEKAPLQVYASALLFSPAMRFKSDGNSLTNISGGSIAGQQLRKTELVLQTLEGTLTRSQAVAFSPDGQLLASASDDWTAPALGR